MKRPYLNGTWYPGAPFTAAPSKRQSMKSGVALIIVLAMLALISILLVAFMAGTAVELRSSKSYAVGLDSRSLADSAANLVIAQIQDATFLTNSSQNYAWASQPGMIRTYDSSGNLVTAYKLYSSGTMRTNSFNPTSLSDIPSAWASSPDQYTDLNKPVIVSGYYHYPIIDPSAVATAYGSTSAADGSTNTPIQGCYLTNAATATTGTSNPVPMPVQWMYILKDGTFATSTASGSLTSSATGNPVASSNPIVGRVAFWTDNESCKVNINTSGEGTFWDRPMTESATTTTGYERGFLANSIPVQNEFQRYPGHPAMTSLSVIFPAVNGETTEAYNERVYGIIPRLATGGSQSGTVAVSTNSTIPVPNANHLYDTVDEFLFNAAGTTPRTVNLKGPSTNFTESDVERVRFFLTANSRAPEVNMFNKPRITLWPLQANTANVSDPVDATNRTAKDKLIALCSTIGNTPYYFQRYSTFDTSQATAQGSPVPSSQSATQDWANVPRNQSLYTSLQYLTSNLIPGLGGSLSGTTGKYATSVRDQILTEMMDFIRSDVTSATTGATPSYFYAPGANLTTGSLITAERQVIPLTVTPSGASYTTQGFGRFNTIKQAALVFYRMDKPTITGAGTSSHTYVQSPTAGNITAATPAKIGIVLLLDTFSPSPGSRPWCENLRYMVTGLSGIKINNVSNASLTTPFPDPGVFLQNSVEYIDNATALFGLEFYFQYNGGWRTLGPTTVGAANEANFYPLYASATLTTAPGQVISPANNGQFQFTPPSDASGNAIPITIKVYPGYDPNVTLTSLKAETPIQTINLNFVPSGSTVAAETVRLPVPTAIVNLSSTVGPPATYSESDPGYWNFNTRIGTGGNGISSVTYGHNPAPIIVGSNGGDGDVVRNIEARSNNTPQLNGATACPAKGDLRIYAALPIVTSDFFEAHGLMDTPADGLHYTDTGTSSKIIHSIRMSSLSGNGMTGTSDGLYTASGGPYGGAGGAGCLIWDSGSTTVGNYFKQNTASGSNKQSNYPAVPRGLTPTQVQLTGLDAALHLGDWDTGPGKQVDGPYINKPDESSIYDYGTFYGYGSSNYGGDQIPNEQGISYSPNRQVSSAVMFGSLPTGIDPAKPDTAGTTITGGSQSTGGIRPWQTLLFCANPAAGLQHPGMGTPVVASSTYTSANAPQPPPYSVPPDSSFLDFFTMPIVEPYAISEPFSTAGKVNMNYQIVPFTYLNRDTAVRAVLKSVRMMAIPQTDKGTGGNLAASYKVLGGAANPGTALTPDYRYTINADEVDGTLAGLQMRFNTGDVFRSAAEICSLYLVPQYSVGLNASGGELVSTTIPLGGSSYSTTPTYSTMNTWWSGYTLTGDNVREAPYGFIYPRLTTKSNTYTVHVWAQMLRKATGTAANQFVDGEDQVTSEYRGSYIIQRYLDPDSDSLISLDGSAPSETNPLSVVGPYKFRILSSKRFAP